MAVGSGYGDHFKTISSSNFEQSLKVSHLSIPAWLYVVYALSWRNCDSTKWLYAAALLYYPSLCFSKLALAEFIRSLTPSTRDQLFARIMECLMGVWALVAMFGTAFECRTPRTWNVWNGQCIDLVGTHCIAYAHPMNWDSADLTSIHSSRGITTFASRISSPNCCSSCKVSSWFCASRHHWKSDWLLRVSLLREDCWLLQLFL